ncbi:hypothetical protein DH2020_025608 [Rehmannia glutinosa]|uniref:Protein ABIL2-like n=1 Tax=Rehmannia glutinosa TaxID=99300 RepID=A0ABR0W357_REHGL
MWSDKEESYSVNASQKASNYDEIFMHNHSLQFAESLKDLKNLRKQLYSAAERFESSYDKNDHKQLYRIRVVQSSKDYVAKALVSTVDHLGSVADKLNKFLDEKAIEFSATTIIFSCIEQRLLLPLANQRKCSKVASPVHHIMCSNPSKKIAASPVNSLTSYGNTVNELFSADATFSKAFQAARKKPDPSLLRKQQSKKMPSREQSPNPLSFSFTRVVPNKEAGRRSISPFRFPLNRLESDCKRSVSPSPSLSKSRCPSEPRRAISACRRQEMTNKEREIESYTSRSKQLFKAMISVHWSRKETVNK